MGSFIREADMLRPIVDNSYRFLLRDEHWDHFYEIQSLKGVIDIVFVVFDGAVLKRRQDYGVQPVQEKSSIDVLVAMSEKRESSEKGDRSLPTCTTTELAKITLYSASYIRRRVLPNLASLGWVERTGNREWINTVPYESPVEKLSAIEVKRGEWQRGLMQAASHTEFSDRTYLAIDAARLPKARQTLYRSLNHAHVGLISVSNGLDGQGVVRLIINAPKKRACTNERHVVAERVLAVRESGGNSGAWGHVFGRLVTTSYGEDPRNSVT